MRMQNPPMYTNAISTFLEGAANTFHKREYDYLRIEGRFSLHSWIYQRKLEPLRWILTKLKETEKKGPKTPFIKTNRVQIVAMSREGYLLFFSYFLCISIFETIFVKSNERARKRQKERKRFYFCCIFPFFIYCQIKFNI